MSTTIDIFQQSYQRCARESVFMDLFYERFLYSSDEVAKKFANTEFRRQKAIVVQSLHMLMRAYEGDKSTDDYLYFLAERHGPGDLDIRPELYSLWLEALLSTVEQTDPEFTPEVEEAWQIVMSHGIEILVAGYE